MKNEARAFLEALYDGQRAVTRFDLDDPERTRWQYTPGPRNGLALEDMDETQHGLAMSLLEAGLSVQGARTARAIMDLEPVLRELEQQAGRAGWERRNPEHYWFSVFGDPASDAPWGWRVGGHHLCLHFTVVDDQAAVTPLFFGANPARVPHGPRRGMRVLRDEEDLARDLLGRLDDARLRQAVVSDEAPDDILTGNAVRAEIAAVPSGIGFHDLSPDQQDAFAMLVDLYTARVSPPAMVEMAGLSFAWAGSTRPGERHYYAIRGATFLVEYDNTQDNANHVHTVWRDLATDWGADLLAEHYRSEHRT